MQQVFAIPTGSNQHHAATHHSQPSTSSGHHEAHSLIPPLSAYGANEIFSNEPIAEPELHKSAFHMVNDHPINAKKLRQRLQEDLKAGIIDQTLYDKEIHNSRKKEEAVKHIMNGGTVYETKLKNVIYQKNLVDASRIEGLRRDGHQAQFSSYKIIEPYGTTKHTFIDTPEYYKHVQREHNRQRHRRNSSAYFQAFRSSEPDTIPSYSRGNLAAEKNETPPPSPPPSPPRSPSPTSRLLSKQNMIVPSLLNHAQVLVAMASTLIYFCFGSPTGSNPRYQSDGESSDSDTASSSSTTSPPLNLKESHTSNPIIPPLSQYAANYLFQAKPIIEPDWDKLSFHMIRDHPANAKRHRKSLDKQLRDGKIDGEAHKTQTHSFKEREKAVSHVLNGGMVLDTKNRAVIYDKTLIDPTKVEEHRANGHQAKFNTNELVGLKGHREDRFHHTRNHSKHYWSFHQRGKDPQDREDGSEHTQVHMNRQQDVIDVVLPHSPDKQEHTPPPSPPSSPSPVADRSNSPLQKKGSRKRKASLSASDRIRQ